MAWSERLVQAETSDGLLHAGLLLLPEGRSTQPHTVVWFHGGGGNFYWPVTLAIGRSLVGRGYRFLSVNTRGHDYGAIQPRTGRPPINAGVAWEQVQDSVYDVAAWVDTAATWGTGSVILVGVSMGALRVAYSLGTRFDERVVGTALLSAPPHLGPPRELFFSSAEYRRRDPARRRPGDDPPAGAFGCASRCGVH